MIINTTCDFCTKIIIVSYIKKESLLRINKIPIPCCRECLSKPKKMLRQQKILLEMQEPVTIYS